MGGHAKRHWGNPLLDKKDLRIMLRNRNTIAEDELMKSLKAILEDGAPIDDYIKGLENEFQSED
jgi:hypothetical protein